MIKKKEEWIADSKPNKRSIFFFQDKVLDLTKFQHQHPGGRKALANYVYKDVTDIVFSVYPHKKEHTLSILLGHVVGKIPPQDMKPNTKIDRQLTPTKEKKKVCFAQIKGKKGKVSTNQKIKGEDSQQNSQKSMKKSKSRQKMKSKTKSKKDLKSTKAIPSKKKIEKEKQNKTINLKRPSLEDQADLDEQKPSFRVPVLMTKNMSSIC